MEEYFVGSEGGELSFVESSDGNILVDKGQNIQQSQSTNVLYAPTQLYFVQGAEQVASQQCIIGGETQTLYRAPVQQAGQQYIILPSELSPSSQSLQCILKSNNTQKDIKVNIPSGSGEHIATLQGGQVGLHSDVINAQPSAALTNAGIQVQRNAVQQNNVTLGGNQIVQQSKKQKIIQTQIVTSPNGQIIDQHTNMKFNVAQQRVLGQFPDARFQQIVGQSGNYVYANKNAQVMGQLKVQQIPNNQRSPIGQVQQIPLGGIQIQSLPARIEVQQNAKVNKLQQRPLAIQGQQSSTGFHIQQGASGIQIQQIPIGTKVSQFSSAVQTQQQNPVKQVQQSSAGQVQHQVSTVKVEYNLPNRQSSLNISNNKIIAQVQPGNAKQLKQASSCISVTTNTEGVSLNSYLLGTQASRLLNTSGGYVMQSKKRPIQTTGLPNYSRILFRCTSCKILVDKPMKCPKCGGVHFTKVIGTAVKPDGSSSPTRPTTSAASNLNIINQLTPPNMVEVACPSCNTPKGISSACPNCNACKQTIQPTSLPEVRPPDMQLDAASMEKQTKLGVKKVTSGRGRGKVKGKGRGKGRGRIPEEPVILTLSSDDETEDEKLTKAMESLSSAPNTTIVLHPKEPVIKNESTSPLDGLLLATLTQPMNIDAAATYAALQCRSIRIGSYRTVPSKKVMFSSVGINLVVFPLKRTGPPVSILIPSDRIYKILVHFGSSLPVFFLYVKPQLAACIRYVLGLNDPTKEYFDPCSKDESQKRITIISEKMNEEAKKLMKHFYKIPQRLTNAGTTVPMLEEIPQRDAHTILQLSSIEKSKSLILKNASLESKSLLVFPPKHKGAVTITIDDYNCLEEEQFLNDVIIDFYLKWLVTCKISDDLRSRTHVFSTFFYKRLTAKPNKGRRLEGLEGDASQTAAVRRHARVKSWTKGVDIFQKDFIIIPINEHSHWFLAVICFPGLNGVITQTDGQQVDQMQKKQRAKAAAKVEAPLPDGDWSDRDEASGDDEELLDYEEEEEEVQKTIKQSTAKPFIKQSCILIFDSLRGASRIRILATLRDYLTVEFRQKRAIAKVFNRDTMKGCVPLVPQQTNLSDCGIYTLHFAESFFEKPLRNYALPIKYLVEWFPQEDVDKKREDIARLIKSLMTEFRPNHGITLPTFYSQQNVAEKLPQTSAINTLQNDNVVQNSAHMVLEVSAQLPTVDGFTDTSGPHYVTKNSAVTMHQNTSESAVNESNLQVEGSNCRKMQSEIIRDSETSEVLLIVNPTTESLTPSVSEDKTVDTVNMTNRITAPVSYNMHPFKNVVTNASSLMPGPSLQSVSSLVVSRQNTSHVLPDARLPFNFASGGKISTPESSSRSLLRLAEIAASRERNASSDMSPIYSNPTMQPIQSISLQKSDGTLTNMNYAGLQNYTTRPYMPPLPPMCNVMSRVVSSGGGCTVSSPAIKGLVSSSRIAERSFVINRSHPSITQYRTPDTPIGVDPPDISSLPPPAESSAKTQNMSNNVYKAPIASTGLPPGPTRVILGTNEAANLADRYPNSGSLIKPQIIFPPQNKLPVGNTVLTKFRQQPTTDNNIVSKMPPTAIIAPTLPKYVIPPTDNQILSTQAVHMPGQLKQSSTVHSVVNQSCQGLTTVRNIMDSSNNTVMVNNPIKSVPSIATANDHSASLPQNTVVPPAHHKDSVNVSSASDIISTTGFRFNRRGTSSRRTIAPPKRYLDYCDVPETVRRTRGRKL